MLLLFRAPDRKPSELVFDPKTYLYGSTPEEAYVDGFAVPGTDIKLTPAQIWQYYAKGWLSASNHKEGSDVEILVREIIRSSCPRISNSECGTIVREVTSQGPSFESIQSLVGIQRGINNTRLLHYLALSDAAFETALDHEPMIFVRLERGLALYGGNHKSTSAAMRGKLGIKAYVLDFIYLPVEYHDQFLASVERQRREFDDWAEREGIPATRFSIPSDRPCHTFQSLFNRNIRGSLAIIDNP